MIDIAGWVVAIVAFVFGMLTSKILSKKEEELTTEICLDYLRKRGYWTKINVSPKNDNFRK